MKVFAVISLVVLAVYVSAEEKRNVQNVPAAPSAFPERKEKVEGHFENPKLTVLKELPSTSPSKLTEYLGGLRGIPSCKLGPRWGNPICFVKCLFRGHAGGVCENTTCMCVN